MTQSVNRFKSIASSIMLIALLFSVSHATVTVKIFSRNEAMSESNISKVRIYIQNTGTETINNFSYRYYFSTENGLPPCIQDYDTPNEQIMLVPSGNGYYIQYKVTGANLVPGGLLPHSSGNIIGLHYNDWTNWDKTNDFSDNLNSEFSENPKIAFYYNGTKIYGNEPGATSGSVLREMWTGISGISTDDIPLSIAPQVTGSQSNLDAPRNFSNNYGVRIRGYITAPLTGNYTFWIASDDCSKLYFSTDDNPSNKGSPIASVTGYTTWQQWNKYTSQMSAVKSLVAGNRYYIEILHKDGDQDDNCSVGWIKPGQSGSVASEIVPSSVLTPYIPAELPAAPTNLMATAISSHRINLSWADASNNELGFRLEMKKEGETFSEFVMISSNQTFYQVSGLEPENRYYFKIRSSNLTGNSDYSDSTSAVTFAASAGTISREVWTDITGTLISNIPVSSPANIVDEISLLETPQQWSNYYGQRIRGYIIPQSTGTYYFWIASDDNSQLWLSPNSDPASKGMIASLSGYTNWQEWNKYGSQKSGPVTLTAGVRYYVEILHKEGNQNDNLSVGWLKPGQSGSVPSEVVPSSVLSPYIVPSIPNSPGGLTATAISATQVDLTWTDNSNNENGFRIERESGDGVFLEIGTVSANVTVFHDAGLTKETQYAYRIRSYNDLGNSGYSSTVTVNTLANGTGIPPVAELNSFAVYSSDSTILKDHCYFNGGGAVGSNKVVEVFPEAIVNGDVVSGGYIRLRSQARVNGYARAVDSVVLHSGAQVTGVEEGATVAIIDIPQKDAIITGSEKVIVKNRTNRLLSPGYYNDLIVETGCTLTISAGLYTFSSFFLQPEAVVLLDIASSDMVDIEVSGDMEFSDRSKVIFKNEGYVPFVRFYTNDPNMVRIGCQVQLNGTVTAPHGDVHLYSRTQCNGALYAKTITVEPDVQVVSDDIVGQCSDSDGDHIQDVLEVILGTDPHDSSDYIPIAIPSVSCINNSNEVTVSYDFSVYFPDYAFATEMEATFPAGSLTRYNVPLFITISNEPGDSLDSMPTFTDSTYNFLGRYIRFLPQNGIVSGKNISFQTPHPQFTSATDFLPHQYADSSGAWDKIPAGSITGSDAISHTITYSSTNPVLYAGRKMALSATTLYFDGGYVYSNLANSVLRFNIGINKRNSDVTNVAVTVKYIDYSTDSTGIARTYIRRCQVNSTVTDTLFEKDDQIVCPGTMRIQEVKLKLTSLLGTVDSCSYAGNQLVFTGQVLVMQAVESARYYIDDPDPSRGISLYYFPCSETFESASFGDGRIMFNTTAGDTDIYAYEYFITDYLGTTRMAINDEHTVTEAVMYHPYGTMVPVGSNSSAIPVREKFTGKEYDQEGSPGVGFRGMDLFYFGKRYYDPEVGIWTSTDPKEQLFNPYAYSPDPLNTIDPDGQWIGALVAAAQWYITSVISNYGEINPGKWNWDSPGLVMSTFMMALSVGMDLGNDFANLSASRNMGGRGAQYSADQNVNVEESPVGHPSDNTPLAQKTKSNFQEYLKDNSEEIGNKEVTQYTYKEKGALKYEHVVGTEENTAPLPRDCSKYIYIDHSHTNPGAAPTGYQQDGNMMRLNGDKSMLSTAKARGYSPDIMRVYNVPDKTWYGFTHHASPDKLHVLIYWKIK